MTSHRMFILFKYYVQGSFVRLVSNLGIFMDLAK